MHPAAVRVVRTRKVTYTFMGRTAVCLAPYMPGQFSGNVRIALLLLWVCADDLVLLAKEETVLQDMTDILIEV